MITDTDRINFIESLFLKNEKLCIESQKSTEFHPIPFSLEMFTIKTQHFYGDNIRDLIDVSIEEKHNERKYYGKEWLKREKEGV